MKANVNNIKKHIESLAEFTSTPGEGVTRLAFSKEDKMARDYIKSQMDNLGLDIREDGYSTVYGKWSSNYEDAKTLIIGSHFDSVKSGGPFDGNAGIVTALEVVRILKEENFKPKFNIEVIAMNDEEGSRFGAGLANSRAILGTLTEEQLDNFIDDDGISVREAMTEFGVTPDLQSSIINPEELKGYIELHIEQGPILEDENLEIGIVNAIVGLNSIKVKYTGTASHAGTTPMHLRRDPLLAAAETALEVNSLAKSVGNCVGTVGQFTVSPGSANVIPASVSISLDLRSVSEETMKKLENEVFKSIDIIIDKFNVEYEILQSSAVPPVSLDEDFIKGLEDSAKNLNLSYKIMTSGAGHDAQNMARICPSVLVFVPSTKGLSHTPVEWTEYEDIGKGIDLITDFVKHLD